MWNENFVMTMDVLLPAHTIRWMNKFQHRNVCITERLVCAMQILFAVRFLFASRKSRTGMFNKTANSAMLYSYSRQTWMHRLAAYYWLSDRASDRAARDTDNLFPGCAKNARKYFTVSPSSHRSHEIRGITIEIIPHAFIMHFHNSDKLLAGKYNS